MMDMEKHAQQKKLHVPQQATNPKERQGNLKRRFAG